MPSTSQSLLNYLRVVVGAWRDDPRDDATLLDQFAEGGAETAFRVLVCRHGPLVWQTCRRILGDTPDAEDAFQTTFLALARKAVRLRREPLGGWLHRVARQAAMNVWSKSQRSQNLERRLRTMSQPEVEDSPDQTELCAVLDEELASLPERLRIPLMLRYLESKTLKEVARIVGCSRRDLGRRLTKGEALLRKRLERRGLAVGVGLVAMLLGGTGTTSAVPMRLIGSTARAAVTFRSGILTGGAAEAARAVLESLPSSSLGTTIMQKSLWIALACCLGLAGAALVACRALSARPDEPAAAGPAVPRAAGKLGAGDRAVARVDCLGDPLPAHALARMGTTRLWQGNYVRFDNPNDEHPSFLPELALVFSPDGKMLATHSEGEPVRLWDTATGKEIRQITNKEVRQLKKHKTSPLLTFSPDGQTLVTAHWDQTDQTVYSWEVATGKLLRKWRYQGPKRQNAYLGGITFLSNGKMLAVGGFTNALGGGWRVHLWEVATGKEIHQLDGQIADSNHVVFSPDGKLLATMTKTKDGDQVIIHLWDVATGKETRQLTSPSHMEGSIMESVAFSRDGKTLALGYSVEDRKPYGRICVWEVATGKPILLSKVGGSYIESKDKLSGYWEAAPLFAYSPDGKTLVWGLIGHLCDAVTGKEIRSFAWEDCPSYAVFSPDGKIVATANKTYGSIRLWEVATGKEIFPHKGHQEYVNSIAYSPDGKMLASASEDKTVRLWEAATGKEIRQLLPKYDKEWDTHIHRGLINVAYSPDGETLASVSRGGIVFVWETPTGREIGQLKGVRLPWSAAFSPEGRILAQGRCGIDRWAGELDETPMIRLMEVTTGKQGRTIGKVIHKLLPTERHPLNYERPGLIAFSPNGRILAAPGKKNMVCLWEIATSKLIGQFEEGEQKDLAQPHNPFVQSLAFSPDGRMVAAICRDNTTLLWEVASGKKIYQLNEPKKVRRPNGMRRSGQRPLACSLAFSPEGRILAVAGGENTGGDEDRNISLWDVTTGKEIGQLAGHRHGVCSVAFSPDGKTMASGSQDMTCLIWDLDPFVSHLKPVRALSLSLEQLEAAWTDLASVDAAKAYQAILLLCAAPKQAIPLLQARVRPIAPLADPKRLTRLIAELDDNDFTVRKKAQREIASLGEVAIPALEQMLKKHSSLEMRRRVQDLLDNEFKPQAMITSARRLREVRSVQALESIATAESQQLLQALAKGVSEASLTRDAQAALKRLAKRSVPRP